MPLAQKMTELFNFDTFGHTDIHTDIQTDRQTDIWIYRAPMELKIERADLISSDIHLSPFTPS